MGETLKTHAVPGMLFVHPMLFRLESDYPFADLHQQVMVAAGKAGFEAHDLLPVFEGRRHKSCGCTRATNIRTSWVRRLPLALRPSRLPSVYRGARLRSIDDWIRITFTGLPAKLSRCSPMTATRWQRMLAWSRQRSSGNVPRQSITYSIFSART